MTLESRSKLALNKVKMMNPKTVQRVDEFMNDYIEKVLSGKLIAPKKLSRVSVI